MITSSSDYSCSNENIGQESLSKGDLTQSMNSSEE
uniref:Uncharacterized protein n=1 Tax=Arundo donax TaxID=35708 RepID=A0A0A8ZK35_ARUDO